MPNRTTTLLKDAILAAGAAAHPEGLVGYLTAQASANPGPFLSLMGKVLPLQVSGDPEAPVKLEVVWRAPSE